MTRSLPGNSAVVELPHPPFVVHIPSLTEGTNYSGTTTSMKNDEVGKQSNNIQASFLHSYIATTTGNHTGVIKVTENTGVTHTTWRSTYQIRANFS